MKYNGKFKVTFTNEPKYYINSEKGTVVCVMNCSVCTPSPIFWYGFSGPMVDNANLTGMGIAKCSKNDVFDENRGKRIAAARAENDCYLKATRHLNKQAKLLNFLLNGISEFTDKAYNCCAHNDDYVDSMVYEAHPHYKKEVTSPKRGVVMSKK